MSQFHLVTSGNHKAIKLHRGSFLGSLFQLQCTENKLIQANALPSSTAACNYIEMPVLSNIMNFSTVPFSNADGVKNIVAEVWSKVYVMAATAKKFSSGIIAKGRLWIMH